MLPEACQMGASRASQHGMVLCYAIAKTRKFVGKFLSKVGIGRLGHKYYTSYIRTGRVPAGSSSVFGDSKKNLNYLLREICLKTQVFYFLGDSKLNCWLSSSLVVTPLYDEYHRHKTIYCTNEQRL